MISLRNVTYSYPAMAAPALKDVSLEIPAGQFCAVVGANGAGKSTLAFAIAGFIPHFYHGRLEGDVTVDGKDTQAAPLHDLVLSVGLIFQNPFNQISGTKFTVREEIAFGLENLGIAREEMLARVEETMALVGIEELADRSPLALSGGQMQRVAIASVLAMRPKVLVLDEPTSQLDPVGSREVFTTVRALVAEGQMTVVMIEHKLEWVAVFADRVIVLSQGTVVADGEPGAILTGEGLLEQGVGQTRYTQAARRARQAGFWPADRRLPVTLEEAAAGFGEANGG
ncbi:MAG TPA: ATP-binding cassette domain-containing protein [Anaerolineales bacterium]